MDTPYSLANLMSGGDLISEISFPSLTVSAAHKSLLQEIPEKEESLLTTEDPHLLETVTKLLERANVGYVRLKPETSDLKKQELPNTSFFQGLSKNSPSFLNNSNANYVEKVKKSSDYIQFSNSLVQDVEMSPVQSLTPQISKNTDLNSINQANNLNTNNNSVPSSNFVALSSPSCVLPTVEMTDSENVQTNSKTKNSSSRKKSPTQTTPEDKLILFIDSMTEENKENRNLPLSSLNYLNAELSKLKLCRNLGKLSIPIFQNLFSLLGPQVRDIPSRIEPLKLLPILESSIILLKILSTEGLPKIIYSEELIGTIISSVHDIITKVILQEELNEEDENIKHEKKQKEKKTSKKLSKIIHGNLTKFSELLEYLSQLSSLHNLIDSHIFELINLSLPLFFVEGINILQLSAMNLIRTIFSQYRSHRDLILDELLGSLVKLPKSKKILKNFSLFGEKHSIQMISSLVLQLIQSCTAIPLSSDQISQDSYEGSLNCARSFITFFMQKCSSKNHEQDYKLILENFVKDLLDTLNLPEWPASEVVLHVLTTALVANLTNSTQPNNLLRQVSLELLGSILAKMREEIIQTSYQSSIFLEEKEILSGKPSDEEEDTSCVCNGKYNQQFMLDCDSCHKWFHGECVAVDERDPPDQWFCQPCSIRKALQTSLSKYYKDEKNWKEPLMRQSVLDYLNVVGSKESFVQFSRQFYISQWYDENEDSGAHPSESIREHLRSQWHSKKIEGKECLSRKHIIAISRTFALKRKFFKNFDSLLRSILGVLSDSHASFRTKVVKALEKIIHSDPSILGESLVYNAIYNRFLDQSIQVRESTVDLIGKYIILRPEYISQYYSIIEDRILDTGLSVRKRVVKILHEICSKLPKSDITAKICVQLVSRINDEESIRELVLKIFQNLWFDKISKAEGNGLDIDSRIQILIKVVENSSQQNVNGSWNFDWLVELLRKLINKENESERESNNSIYSICSLICIGLVNLLVSISEESSENSNSVTKFLYTLATLNVFCLAAPSLVVSQAERLLIYFQNRKRDSNNEKIISYLASIFELTVPLIEFPDSSFISELEANLIVNIKTHGTNALQMCIKCLCKITSNESLLEDLLFSFFKILQNNLSSKQDRIRAFFVVGLLCRFHDFTRMNNSKSPFLKSNVLEEVFQTFLNFVHSKESDIVFYAYQALGYLFIRLPSLMSRAEQLINKSLQLNASPKMKAQTLKCFSDLLFEDEIISKQERQELTPSENQYSRVSSAFLQSYITNVLELVFDNEQNVRSTALNLISQLLRHGLVTILECAPFIVAILSDSSKISERANILLRKYGDSNPDSFHSRALEGIRKSYEFQMKLFKFCKDIDPSHPLFNDLYLLFKHKKKINFLNNLLQIFENPLNEPLGFLKFLIELLASFPYTSEEEIATILNRINLIISIQGSDLLNLKNEFKSNKSKLMDDPSILLNHYKSITCFTLFLTLKRFLNEVYHLSNNKIQTINDKPTKEESVASKSIENCSITEHIWPFPSKEILLEDISFVELKECFDKFKEMMKNDSLDNEFKISKKPGRPSGKRKRTEETNNDNNNSNQPNTTKKQKKAKGRRKKQSDEENSTEDDYIP